MPLVVVIWLTLYFSFEDIWIYILIYIIPPHYSDTGRTWHDAANTMAADGLATDKAKAFAAIVLSYLSPGKSEPQNKQSISLFSAKEDRAI